MSNDKTRDGDTIEENSSNASSDTETPGTGSETSEIEDETYQELLSEADTGSLGEEEQKKLGKAVRSRMSSMSASYSGPLPPPGMFNQYPSNVQEKMIELLDEGNSLTQEMAREDKKIERRGQTFGLIIGIAGLIAACFITIFSPVAASVVAAIDLFSLVAVFVIPSSFSRG